MALRKIGKELDLLDSFQPSTIKIPEVNSNHNVWTLTELNVLT